MLPITIPSPIEALKARSLLALVGARPTAYLPPFWLDSKGYRQLLHAGISRGEANRLVSRLVESGDLNADVDDGGRIELRVTAKGRKAV